MEINWKIEIISLGAETESKVGEYKWEQQEKEDKNPQLHRFHKLVSTKNGSDIWAEFWYWNAREEFSQTYEVAEIVWMQ